MINEDRIEQIGTQAHPTYHLKCNNSNFLIESESLFPSNETLLNQLFLLNDFLQNPIYRNYLSELRNPHTGSILKSIILRYTHIFNTIKKQNLLDFLQFLLFILFMHEKHINISEYEKEEQELSF